MAESVSYPKVSSHAWRTLRNRAATAPSTKLTPAAVAAILEMSSPKSAADNVVYPLRRLGLIDDEGGLTDRGQKWRVDGSYGDACDEILSDVYPAELASLTDDDGQPDKSKVKTWLQHKGLGDSNATNMASTYVMIAERKIPEAAGPHPAPRTRQRASTTPASSASGAVTSKPASDRSRKVAGDSPPSGERGSEKAERGSRPEVRLDIQIHIPASASAEQIDQIFASMAKHLYQS